MLISFKSKEYFIGSADKFNERNPLPISLRLQFVKEAINDKFKENNNINIIPLDDLTNENDNSHDWGFYLYSKIVTETKNPNFTIYYSDGFEIITTWFPSFLLRNNVSLCLLARNTTEKGISATTVRNLILDENLTELKNVVPKIIYENYKTIKKHIELSKLIKS